MLYSLICEGHCNLSISYVDDKIAEAAKNPIPAGEFIDPAKPHISHETYIRGNAALWTTQRHLRYTPHRMVTEIEAKCQTCGHIRPYGARRQEVA